MADIAALTTARLHLRGVTLADAPAIQKRFADYDIIRHLNPIVPWPYPTSGARDFLDSLMPVQGQDRWVWALFLKSAPAEAIGIVDLRRGAGENRGFWLARHLWGQGLMTEACDAVTDYAFTELGFERLTLCNAVGNTRSRRIKEKAGATFLRVEPASFVDPALTEHEVWELRRATWAARRRKIIPRRGYS
jgi:RimJ/RimL family protein N-acetyltransferase